MHIRKIALNNFITEDQVNKKLNYKERVLSILDNNHKKYMHEK